MAKMHVHEVHKLIKTLNEPDPRKEAAGLFRGCVDRIVLTPDATKTRLVIDLAGDLAGILAMSETRHSAEPSVSVDTEAAKSLALAPYHLGENVSPKAAGKAGCGSSIWPFANALCGFALSFTRRRVLNSHHRHLYPETFPPRVVRLPSARTDHSIRSIGACFTIPRRLPAVASMLTSQ